MTGSKILNVHNFKVCEVRNKIKRRAQLKVQMIKARGGVDDEKRTTKQSKDYKNIPSPYGIP